MVAAERSVIGSGGDGGVAGGAFDEAVRGWRWWRTSLREYREGGGVQKAYFTECLSCV